MSRLKQLLESIDPERTWEDTQRLADVALNTFPLGSSRVSDWAGFHTITGRFVCHLENTVLNIHRDYDPDFDFGRAVRFLRMDFGPNGDITAAQISINGIEGGLYRVLKSLAMRMVEEYSENEVTARVHRFWNSLDSDERLEACREYLQKFSRYLPQDVTEGSAPRVLAFLPQFLVQHPKLIRRLREVGRGQ